MAADFDVFRDRRYFVFVLFHRVQLRKMVRRGEPFNVQKRSELFKKIKNKNDPRVIHSTMVPIVNNDQSHLILPFQLPKYKSFYIFLGPRSSSVVSSSSVLIAFESIPRSEILLTGPGACGTQSWTSTEFGVKKKAELSHLKIISNQPVEAISFRNSYGFYVFSESKKRKLCFHSNLSAISVRLRHVGLRATGPRRTHLACRTTTSPNMSELFCLPLTTEKGLWVKPFKRNLIRLCLCHIWESPLTWFYRAFLGIISRF